jgi:hypothetical protein
MLVVVVVEHIQDLLQDLAVQVVAVQVVGSLLPFLAHIQPVVAEVGWWMLVVPVVPAS